MGRSDTFCGRIRKTIVIDLHNLTEPVDWIKRHHYKTTYLLCRKCSSADSRSVGFDDPVDITNSGRRNSESSQHATNRTVARRYETERNMYTDVKNTTYLVFHI